MTIPSDSRRLSILSPKEVDDLYGLPDFSDEERLLYFELSPAETELVAAVRTQSVAVHLILQIGYFKAKRQFFHYCQEAIQTDLVYIHDLHFPDRDLATFKLPSRPIRLEQQQAVLKLFNHRLCTGEIKRELECKSQRIAMLSTHPIYILRELMQHLTQQRVVVPRYRFLQEMIGRVVAAERKRVTQLLNKALPPEVATQLELMLHAGEGMYRVSTLKHEPKDFSYKEMRQEVELRNFFQPVFEFAQNFLASAGLSVESGKYYASLVSFYSVYKLQRMHDATTRLYLLCFAFHSFREINDNLIDAFIHLVNHYEAEAEQAAGVAIQRATTDASDNLQAAGSVLNLFIDTSITDDTLFVKVKEKAFAMLEPESFPLVTSFMRNIAFDKAVYEWSFYSKLSRRFKRNLRHLFSCIEFAGRVEDAPLLDAVVFMQTLFRQGNSPSQKAPSAFPISVIPKSVKGYLFDPATDGQKEKVLNVDRYEFLLYRLLKKALAAGDVFVQDSTEYHRFEDDLISDARWQNKDAVLREIGLPILQAPIKETMAAFNKTLETKFAAVNQRIADGLNKHLVVKNTKGERRWSLRYPEEGDEINSPFYSQLPGIGIADLLWFVADKTGFLGSFTHALDRYVKHDPEPREILACIVAMGSNMGLGKMAEVSGMSNSSMASTARSYLRLETLRAANDAVCNATAALPIFPHYNIDDTVHSSSDGQRMETQIDTINARYSLKYFGLQKGVSAYTLIANHVPINAKIIGTHEHESHYVFDILNNNTSDVKPQQHSTDTHGTNQVNFWILHAFGYRFAPRYRGLHKRTDSLIGFRHPSHYDDFLIKPSRNVYEDLVEKEWPNILRIMASLAQKDVTQATIIRKLSSYGRQNQTKKHCGSWKTSVERSIS